MNRIGLIVLGLCFVAGCHKGPEMYQVSGQVRLKDGGVPKAPIALIRFEPVKDSSATIRRNATSPIAPDGSFTLFTRKPGDGVNKGEYKVAFTFCKSPVDTKPMVADKYWNPNESPYSVTVDQDLVDQVFEVEMLPGAAGSKGG